MSLTSWCLRFSLTSGCIELKQSLLPNVRFLILSGLISPNVPFTYIPFWKIIWYAVNRCLYSIDPGHFMVGENSLYRHNHTPCPQMCSMISMRIVCAQSSVFLFSMLTRYKTIQHDFIWALIRQNLSKYIYLLIIRKNYLFFVFVIFFLNVVRLFD